MKYTKEILLKAAKNNISMAGVLRYLKLRPSGGMHTYLCKRIKEFEIDISHFLGKSSNRGIRHRGGPTKKLWQKILIKRKKGRREKAIYLRRALIESGRTYKCAACNQSSTWNNKPLSLQVDHINQDWLDDRKENLRFMCPNCHSQSKGWCNRK